jgi:hypothetical protein
VARRELPLISERSARIRATVKPKPPGWCDSARMPNAVCTFHAGTLSNEDVRRLETGLRRVYRDQLGDHALRVLWSELPAGQAFTAGRASDVTYLLVEVEDGLPATRREAALRALATELATGARIPVERVMITIGDRSVFRRFLAAYRGRVRPRSRPWFWATTLLGLWRSRRRAGYLAIRTNL